jgi:hypothetical protein
MKPENLVANAFLDSLGTDWVAVANNGHPVGRATTETAVRQAVPDAVHYLCAKDLADVEVKPAKAEPNPVAVPLEAVKAQAIAPEIAEKPGFVVIDDPLVASEGPSVAPGKPFKDPFDHDNSGFAGGSAKGEQSTAHKGVVRRAAAKAKK